MNLRHALRALVADWRFSSFVFVILALGIGVNTAMYSLVDAVLFSPLGLPREEQLVRVFASEPDGSELGPSVSFPVYTDYRDQSRSFQSLAAFAPDVEVDVATRGSEPQPASATIASGNYFATLGGGAIRGRVFTPEDDRNGNHVAVISEAMWKTRFGGRPDAVGSAMRINTTQFTIVGVMPARFRGASIDTRTDLWVPSTSVVAAWPGMADEETLTDRRTSWISIVGRLRDGVTLPQAQAELRAIAARRAAGQVKFTDPSATLLSATTAAIDIDRRVDVRRIALLVMMFVGLILAIACINAGGLQLVRGEKRQRELAIRTALGASRRRLVAQLSVESLLLALSAGVAGIGIAQGVVRLLSSIAPDNFPLLLHASLPMADPGVLAVTAGLTVATAFVFGVVPALRSSRIDVSGVMKGAGSMPRRRSLQSLLVAAQIALSAVLLVFSGLMLRTLGRVTSVDPGFRTAGAVVGSLNASRQGYVGPEAVRFFDAIGARLEAMPQVASAGFARSVPIQATGMRATVGVPGYQPKPTDDANVDLNVITPGFLRALGVPIVRGRDFDRRDVEGSTPVVLVNEEMARRFWPDGDALGAQIEAGPQDKAIVVGIVATTRLHSLREEPMPSMYLPLGQLPMRSMTLLVRTKDGLPATAERALQSAVRAVDSNIPIAQLRTLDRHIGASIAQERTFAILLGGFGALALLLASAGLFGVVAYQTASRRRELGIRMALGASHRHVAAIVIRRTALLVGLGVAAGMVCAALLTRFAEALLFGVTSRDPVTFALVPVLLFLVGVAATFGPVRRASSVAPSETLRYE